MLTALPILITFLRSILRRHEIFLYACLRRYRLIVSGVVTFIAYHFCLSDRSSRCRLVIDRFCLHVIIFESIVKLVSIVIEHVCTIFIIEVSASQWVVTHILWLWFLHYLLILFWGWHKLSLLLIVALLRFWLILRSLFLFFVISLLNRWGIVDDNFPVRLLLLNFRLIDLLFSLRLIFGLILFLVTFRRLLIGLLRLLIV